MAGLQETAQEQQEQVEDEMQPSQNDTMFAFDIPSGVKAGVTLQVRAPDGVLLKIPLPGNVHPGDRMTMQKKADTGKWGIKHVVRNEEPAAPVEPNGQVTRRSDAQVGMDLGSSNVCTVTLETSRGDLHIRIVPSWAPKGAQRFLQLVTDQYYTDVAVYRAVPDFLVQFGVIADRERSEKYEAITDDLIRGIPIQDGSVCFAAAGPNTRTATMCIFLNDYPQLGGNPWETPIGKVAPESMELLHSLYTGYGDMPQCGGKGPDPIELEKQGNDYIRDNFPKCDFVNAARWSAS